MSTNVIRVDNAVAAGNLHPNPAVKNLFNCLKQNFDKAWTSKEALGDSLGLGYYWKPDTQQAKTDTKNVRNQVRACLMLYLTIGGGRAGNTAFKNERTRLMGLNATQLEADMLAKLQAGPQATPTSVRHTSFSPGEFPDHIVHNFSFECSTGNLFHVAHCATREFVKYLRFRVGTGEWIAIDDYSRAPDFPRERCAPWFPNAEGSNPGQGWPYYLAPPNPTIMGPYQNILGAGTDNHSFGRHGLCVESGGHKGMVSAALVESTIYAEQEYQYNATCNPATWQRPPNPMLSLENRMVHANDQHWTAFPNNAKWILERRIFRHATTGRWMLEFNKRGNQPSNASLTYTRTGPLFDEQGRLYEG